MKGDAGKDVTFMRYRLRRKRDPRAYLRFISLFDSSDAKNTTSSLAFLCLPRRHFDK